MIKDTIILFYPTVDPINKIPNLPFSVLNLERMIRHLLLNIIIIDERIQPAYEEIIINNRDRILLVGVSAMTGNQILSGKRFSEFVKIQCNSNIIWGGWFVSVSPKIALNESFIDFIITGQGEIPFKSFVEAIITNSDYKNIPGLGYKKNNHVIINDRVKPVNEVEFPDIDFSKIDLEKFININGHVNENERSLNYICGSGCPYNCAFCCLPTIWNQISFKKEINTVINDLTYFHNELKIHKLGFNDDNFFSKHSFVISLCQEIIDRKIDIYWEANGHIDTFIKNYSHEDIMLLCRAGCKSIKFGVESGDQEILNRINKKTTVQNCLDVAKLLSNYQIKCVFYIMIAFPWNPDKDIDLTLKLLGKAKIANKNLAIAINFFIPLPSTPLYYEAINYGFKEFEKFEDFEDFILKPYSAPWWTNNYRKEIHDYIWFYFKYADPQHYKLKEKNIRKTNYFVNKLAYPFCYLRLSYNIRNFRIEARIYFILRKLFNILTKNKYADNSEVLGRFRSWNR